MRSILELGDSDKLLAFYETAIEMSIGANNSNPIADRSNWAVQAFMVSQSDDVSGYAVYDEMLPLFIAREARLNEHKYLG